MPRVVLSPTGLTTGYASAFSKCPLFQRATEVLSVVLHPPRHPVAIGADSVCGHGAAGALCQSESVPWPGRRPSLMSYAPCLPMVDVRCNSLVLFAGAFEADAAALRCRCWCVRPSLCPKCSSAHCSSFFALFRASLCFSLFSLLIFLFFALLVALFCLFLWSARRVALWRSSVGCCVFAEAAMRICAVSYDTFVCG